MGQHHTRKQGLREFRLSATNNTSPAREREKVSATRYSYLKDFLNLPLPSRNVTEDSSARTAALHLALQKFWHLVRTATECTLKIAKWISAAEIEKYLETISASEDPTFKRELFLELEQLEAAGQAEGESTVICEALRTTLTCHYRECSKVSSDSISPE